MRANEIRELFLNYFQKNGHRIIPSSPLVLDDDPSVLFTSAGMQQFKWYYTLKLSPFKSIHPYLNEPLNTKNVTTCQKCFRTSDIELVGDRSHLTFFEMLGNFSFGGYFKKEAIELAYKFIFEELKIEKERVYFTFYPGDKEKNILKDEESLKVLKNLKIENKMIKEGTSEDNFWGPTGESGPCGPTVEIYIDDLEIWNLVFNEYFKDREGNYVPLKQKGVDTGMGLERLALILQYPKNKEKTVFETDLFSPLMEILFNYFKKEDLPPLRIISDHLKAISFLIGEVIEPSNVERGYVLRRLIRRISRIFKKFHFDKNQEIKILNLLIEKIIEIYKDFYPEIDQKEKILNVLKTEIDKFDSALEKGLKEWQKILKSKEKINEKEIKGEEVFKLYQSYGFPLDLITEIAKENGLKIDEDGFKKAFSFHQEISRKSQEKKFGGHGILEISSDRDYKIVKLHTATHLLLASLKKLIDSNIEQKGSDINEERLRFDFSYNRKLTKEELKAIEDLINQKIKEGLEVEFYEAPLKGAIRKGAWGTFKERYPEKVRVYMIKEKNGEIFSHEICKGPHVKNTQEIKGIQIIEHESVSAGVKRIKAVLLE